jgi:hypothetical protein
MQIKEKIGKGLENILKKVAVPAGITAIHTPIHEGIHAGMATLLPDISSQGVALNNTQWYAKPFEWITFGYMKAAELEPTIGGQALIQHADTTVGHLSSALTAALPEVTTMTLAMYWIKQSIENITEKGEKLGALAKVYCGFALASASHAYMTVSNVQPREGYDYYNFTKSIISATGLPSEATGYVTFIGTGLMVAGALYATNKISKIMNRTKIRGKEVKEGPLLA